MALLPQSAPWDPVARYGHLDPVDQRPPAPLAAQGVLVSLAFLGFLQTLELLAGPSNLGLLASLVALEPSGSVLGDPVLL